MTQLFKGGLVFDGKGRILEDTGVFVNNGRIERIASITEFEGFTGEIVDTSEGTLMPGLTDCHVHLCYQATADPAVTLSKLTPGQITMKVLENAQLTLQRGITSVRDCGGKDYLEFAVRDAIQNGIFSGPTIHASGRMICMTGGHGNKWGRVADGVDEVVKAVREQIHAGCDMVKIMATGGVMTPGVNPEDAHYSPEEMKSGIHEAHRFHRKTASHAQGKDGILNAVRGGIDSIEHGIFMDETCIREMLDTETFLVPTISALRNILDNADRGIPDFIIEKARRVEDQHRLSLLNYYQAGGKIAMGTDAGTPFNRHGDNAQELQYMVDYGIAAPDALQAACYNGAQLMGLDDQGYIAKDAAADLLIVKGNPVTDIRMASDHRNHVAVFKAGKLVSQESQG